MTTKNRDRPISYTSIDIMYAKRNLIRAAVSVRIAQIKKFTNHGVGYHSHQTAWLRQRMDTLIKRENEIDQQIQEAENDHKS